MTTICFIDKYFCREEIYGIPIFNFWITMQQEMNLEMAKTKKINNTRSKNTMSWSQDKIKLDYVYGILSNST